METYEVEERLARVVEKLAERNQPFEQLDFNEALRRVIRQYTALMPVPDLEDLLAISLATQQPETTRKRATSPDPSEWVKQVPDLHNRKGLTTWQAVCTVLSIETNGDSARRKLGNWVRSNKPTWPSVPGT